MKRLKIKIIACICMVAVLVQGFFFPGTSEGNTTRALAADYGSISQFPESYQKYLWKLQSAHPNWKFEPFYTGLDWNTVVASEFAKNKSLMAKSANHLFKSNEKGDYNPATKSYYYKDSSHWVRASQNAVAYFVDPRNWLNDVNVFMFEDLTYRPEIQTQSGVEKILAGTFMGNKFITFYNKKGKKKKTKIKYSTVIMRAAKSSGVSPYYLASKIRQEVGASGSGSTSGRFPGHRGLYNFYNIGASDSRVPIANGLSFAGKSGSFGRPWTTPVKAIMGGASYIHDQFMGAGQFNGYVMRFNVNPNSTWGLFSHQYMTNLSGASQESVTTYQAHSSMGTLNDAKVFRIPVYKNMPEEDNTVSFSGSVKTAKINTSTVLRSQPDNTGSTVIRLKKNASVTIEGGAIVEGNYEYDHLKYPYWMKVKYTSGDESYSGYVFSDHVTPDASMVIGKKQSYQLSTTQKMGKEAVYFMSDNPAVATVSATGRITTLKKDGYVTIYAFLGCGAMDAIRIKVIGSGSIQMSKDSANLYADKTLQLRAKVKQVSLSQDSITWKSSDKTVATVDETGFVTAKSVGTAIISAKASNGIETNCEIKVNPDPTKELQVKSTSLQSVILKWNKVSKSRGYEILRKGPWDRSYRQVALIRGNSRTTYRDRNVIQNKKYTYKVRSYRTISGTKYQSAYRTVTAYARLQTPEIQKGRFEDGKISLKWKKVPDASGYLIYRRSAEGSYKKIAKVNKASTVKFTDKKIKEKERYSYRIAAFQKIKGKTVYSKNSVAVHVHAGNDREAAESQQTTNEEEIQQEDSGTQDIIGIVE